MNKFLVDDSNFDKKNTGLKNVGKGLYIPKDMNNKEKNETSEENKNEER